MNISAIATYSIAPIYRLATQMERPKKELHAEKPQENEKPKKGILA